MPTDIIMNDAWPAGENISPALDRYRYGTTEIYSNSNDSGGAYFSGFRIEDNIYHFIVTFTTNTIKDIPLFFHIYVKYKNN